jgi:hypothetical protein
VEMLGPIDHRVDRISEYNDNFVCWAGCKFGYEFVL